MWCNAASRQDCIIRNLSQTQKNRLYETVLLSTQNMFEQMNKKIIKILQQNFLSINLMFSFVHAEKLILVLLIFEDFCRYSLCHRQVTHL